ncbi:hypothetical protein U1Q18_046905, partial [Sarracenia purpurea var. burkii]
SISLVTSSLSRLNANAPELVPSSSPSPSMDRADVTHHPRLLTPPSQAPPPGLIKVYPPIPNFSFQIPIHGGRVAVPVVHNHGSLISAEEEGENDEARCATM